VENVLPEPAKPAQEFLTLSPMPTPRPDTLRLLEGEARGRFAVLPDANSGTAGTDSGRPAAPGNDGAKAAKDDQAQTAADANKREGAPSGVTAGTASSGTGRGKDAFPGITILESGNANPIVTTTGRPAPLQTSYGITILSTEASGGGLPHVGVFSDEQIYTVYVDMRRTVTDPAPSWTFEYGVPKNTQASPHSAKTITRMQQGLVLPFPVVKEQPAFPADLVRKYLKRRIIVFAMINADGKFEKISVKESPDPLLNEAVISALTKWSFRPAQADGEVVPVKALIGIPLVLIP
jgi:hypothetical protein